MIDDSTPLTTGTVEWFDDERGVGLISPDDGAPPCAVHAGTLLACGISWLAAGDRVRFWTREEGGERTAEDLTLFRAEQRWENEGGAVEPGNQSTGASAPSVQTLTQMKDDEP